MHPSRIVLCVVVAAVTLAASGPTMAWWPAAAMVGGYEPDPADTRFDAVGAFTRTQWLPNHNTFGNGTLIAPDTVLLAAHLLPSTDGAGRTRCDPLYTPPAPGTYSMRFRRKPDGSIGSIAQGQASFHEVAVREFILAHSDNGGCRDIAIAILETPVLHIKPIRVELDTPPAIGDPIVLGGWGKEGPGFNQGPRGRLLLADSVCTYNATSIGFPNAFSPPYPPGPNMFDSGGAILAPGPCRTSGYRLVGVITTTGGGTSVPALTGKFREQVPVFDAECAERYFVYDRDHTVPVVGGVRAGVSVAGAAGVTDEDFELLDASFPVTGDGLGVDIAGQASAAAAVSTTEYHTICASYLAASCDGSSSYALTGHASQLALGFDSERHHDTLIDRDPRQPTIPPPPPDPHASAGSVFDGTAYHQLRLAAPFAIGGSGAGTLDATLASTRGATSPAGGFTLAQWSLLVDVNGNGVADPGDDPIAGGAAFVEGSGTDAAAVQVQGLARGTYILYVTVFTESVTDLYSTSCGETLESAPEVTDEVDLVLSVQ